jgi:hypothetical protein
MKSVFSIITTILMIFTCGSNIIAQNRNENLNRPEIKNPECLVEFPTAFILEEQKDENGFKTELYKGVKDNVIYIFQYSEHMNPIVSIENEKYVRAALNAFIKGINAVLISDRVIEHNKIKGIEAELSVNNKDMNVFYRLFIVNKVQYELTVLTKLSAKNEEIDKFFNSFKIN